MKPVFVDAFFYVACLNRADQHHEKVMSFARQPLGRMVTTRWVLIEVADALAASASRNRLAGFVAALEMDAGTTIVESRPALFQRGLKLYDERADKEWTLTDCISSIVMADEGLMDALTGDHHFEQAGFRALLK
jgi:hypothetical protein